MKCVIFLSYLNLWSMENQKGAPSFYKTIDSYIKDGWNVFLINPNYNNGYTPTIEGLKNYSFVPYFYQFTKIKGIGFIARIAHAVQGNLLLYRLARKVIKENSRENILIYSYEVHGVKAGKKIANNNKLPLVTRFQGTNLKPFKDNVLNRIRRYPHFSALQTKANITIMTNDGTQGDKVLESLNNSSEIVKFWRNGVDIDTNRDVDLLAINNLREKLKLNVDDIILMTISRLASWKKVERAIDALYLAKSKVNNLKLVVVGDGDQKNILVEHAKNLNLEDNVIFVGAVEQSEIKNYLDMADIFLSLYDLSNVGNPLLEAMSCGKPIITLDVGDTNQVIKNRENGLLVSLNELNEIPNKIIELIEDNQLSSIIGKNARKYAQDNFWSWQERMDAELELTNELLSNWNFDNQSGSEQL